MRSKTKIISQIICWLSAALVFLLPLFVLPFTADFFDFNKNIFLIFTVGLLTLLWLIKMAVRAKVKFKYSKFVLPLILILIAFIASTFIVSANKVESLTNNLTTGTIVALSFFYLVVTNNFSNKSAGKLIIAFTLSGTLTALISIYQFLGLGELTNTPWLAAKSFSPTGGLLPAIGLIIPSLLVLTGQALKRAKAKPDALFAFIILGAILTGAGLVLDLYQLFSSAKPVTLGVKESWVIAVDSLKANPLLGVGPADYLSAFLRFRPINFNNTAFWNLKFSLAANYYLHALATTGLLGLTGFVWLIFNTIKSTKTILKSELEAKIIFACLLAVFLLLGFVPASLTLVFSFYLLLAILALYLPTDKFEERSKILPVILLIVLSGFCLFSFYQMQKIWRADYYYRLSLDAISRNEGSLAYQNQIKAIELNKSKPLYHIAYSQTNLALANSMASEKDLSDQDRSTITSLIQQAITQAKIGVTLNQNDSSAWENLASIYRQLINIAQGADQWAIASYQRAIVLDPTNPNLTLNLGGVYYGLKNYDEAVRWFQRAVDVKPDFANAHYNMAAAFREKKDYSRALTEMNFVLDLVDTQSGDYQIAIMEIDELKKKLDETQTGEAKEAETLAVPSPFPSPAVSPMQLEQESAPPSPLSESIATPTPTPTTGLGLE